MPIKMFNKLFRKNEVKPAQKVYVITWVDTHELVTVFNDREKAREFCKESGFAYMWTELTVM